MVLRVGLDDSSEVYNFAPDQYAEVSFIDDSPDSLSTSNKLVRRQYSIASASGDTSGLEF